MTATNNSINNSTDNNLLINSLSNDGASETLDFNKSRASGVITTGDVLGGIFFNGFDGTNFISGAKITSTSSGTIGAARIPADLKFYTHPDSNSAALQRMAIATTGAITIASPDSGTALTISGGGLNVTGTTVLNTPLAVSYGGTNASSFTTDGVVYFDGTILNSTAVGSSGQVLTSNGSGAPTFQASSSASVITYVSINHGNSPYTALSTDYYISCDVTLGVITVKLPNGPATGRVFIVKDQLGLSPTSNISVTTVGGIILLDGSATYIMNTAYEVAQFVFNGSFYEIF